MDHFEYRDGVLHCEDVPVSELAEQYGTPLYVYSEATLLHHLRQIQTAFATAEPIKLGRTLGIVDIRVTDDQGKLVAIGRGAFSTREG